MKPPRPTPRRSRWALAAFAGLALAVAGCGGRQPAIGVSRNAPVILISIDTLRADHLPAYGYKAVATPAIDGLRRDGILYTHAYSQTPLTLPSHTTILSGLLPEAHGVRDNVGYSLDDAKVRSGELPYLPEMLKKAGYATGGAVSAYVLRRKTGLAEGFDFFEDSIEFRTGTGLGGLQRPGSETLRLTLPWLRSVKDKPFFLFFHLYEPHTPYDPPEPYRSRYASRYDGEIATADHVVGELLAELRTLGVYDRAVIVLCGDHGEGLGEHGEDEHGVLLYNEDIHVPLIVKLPGAARGGGTVDAPAGLFDVAPTIAAQVGLPSSPAWKGLPLTDLLRADTPPRRIYSETFYPRLHFGWSDLASLADGSHHLIEGPDPELYDLRADPDERRNLRAADRRLYAEFHQALQGYNRTLAPPAAVDEETRKAMASLGYIGTAGATSGPLPDPKTKVASLADLKNAFQLMGEKRYPEAAQALRRVIDQNPLMADAWEYLGRAEQRLGDRDAALAAYIEALKVSGGAPHIALAVASIYFEMERYDEAAAHARMALGEHASFAHGMLARIALRRHQLDEAEREAKAAAAADQGDRIGPTLTLAEVAEGRGRYDEALALTRQAEQAYEAREAKDPDLIQGLYLLRGTILADQADAPGAEAAFEKEIALFPDDPRAYSHLALLYALLGDGPKVGDTLRRMVEARPAPDSYVEAVRTLRVVRDQDAARRLLAYAQQKFPRSSELRALAGGGG